jgi:two-component system, NarL family, invasion response regulator UvrY
LAHRPATVTLDVVDVLVVDDQPAFRAVARTLVSLTPDLCVVAEAETGEQAVDVANRLRPAVVLMDVNLPGISGIEAARRIVALDPSVKVVLMSTYAAADLPSDAMLAGVTGYLRKEDLTPGALSQLLAG